MELTYRTEGDYRLPNLEAPEAPKVGKYGMLRRSYLQTHTDILAFLALLKRILRLPLRHGSKSNGAKTATNMVSNFQETVKIYQQGKKYYDACFFVIVLCEPLGD